MRQSVAEPRADGKASPKVGAVLLKPDGTVQTACRGELRHGDHAEFTLLERMNRASNLDGAILFATLEPCAPNARRFPKLGCAERIVLAHIKEVWVGIEDPDPTVDRKGIKYLQDSGVAVQMFDQDLQEAIQKENREFIDQALERAAAFSEKRPVEVTLSALEPRFAITRHSTIFLQRHWRPIARLRRLQMAWRHPRSNRALRNWGFWMRPAKPTGRRVLVCCFLARSQGRACPR